MQFTQENTMQGNKEAQVGKTGDADLKKGAMSHLQYLIQDLLEKSGAMEARIDELQAQLEEARATIKAKDAIIVSKDRFIEDVVRGLKDKVDQMVPSDTDLNRTTFAESFLGQADLNKTDFVEPSDHADDDGKDLNRSGFFPTVK